MSEHNQNSIVTLFIDQFKNDLRIILYKNTFTLFCVTTNSFGYDLWKHSRITFVRSPFDRPAFLSYSGQNKGGKYVCILRVLEDFGKRNCTVSARTQRRDAKMHSHREIETTTLDTRTHDTGFSLWILMCWSS